MSKIGTNLDHLAKAVSVGVSSAVLLPAFVVGAQLPLRGELAIQQPYPAQQYRAVGEWLASSTPQKSTVGYIEVGYVGYYSMRTIIDPLGLVTPGVLPHVVQGDIAFAFREWLPDYILVNPRFDALMGPFDQEPWFRSCYRPAATVADIEIFLRCKAVPENDRVVLELAQPDNDHPAGEVVHERSIGQTFVARQDGLRSVALLLATYGRQLQGPLVFHLQSWPETGRGQELVVQEFRMEQVEDNAWRLFSFAPIENSQGEQYYAFLEAPHAVSGETITAWATGTDSYSDGTLMLGHEPAAGDLSLRLYYVRSAD